MMNSSLMAFTGQEAYLELVYAKSIWLSLPPQLVVCYWYNLIPTQHHVYDMWCLVPPQKTHQDYTQQKKPFVNIIPGFAQGKKMLLWMVPIEDSIRARGTKYCHNNKLVVRGNVAGNCSDPIYQFCCSHWAWT